MSDARRILGIDPGKHGGFALLVSRQIVKTWTMPIVAQEIDPALVWSILQEAAPTVISLERVRSMPRDGKVSAFSFGYNFGCVRSLILLYCFQTGAQFLEPTPQQWQKIHKLTGKAGTAKDRTLRVVRSLHPQAQIVPARCRIPHDGIVDAIGIATHASFFFRETKK